MRDLQTAQLRTQIHPPFQATHNVVWAVNTAVKKLDVLQAGKQQVPFSARSQRFEARVNSPARGVSRRVSGRRRRE